MGVGRDRTRLSLRHLQPTWCRCGTMPWPARLREWNRASHVPALRRQRVPRWLSSAPASSGETFRKEVLRVSFEDSRPRALSRRARTRTRGGGGIGPGVERGRVGAVVRSKASICIVFCLTSHFLFHSASSPCAGPRSPPNMKLFFTLIALLAVTPTLSLEVCGNFCGPTWCNGGANSECSRTSGSACTLSQCSASGGTDGSCADWCCKVGELLRVLTCAPI